MSESNDRLLGRGPLASFAGRFKLFGRNVDSLQGEPFLSSVPLRILVAPLLNDTNSRQTSRVIDALRTHLNAGKLQGHCDYRRLTAPIHPRAYATGSTTGSADEHQIASHIQSRLAAYDANLMIWGHVVNDDQTLQLSITARQAGTTKADHRHTLDGPTLMLPENFASELGAAIAALVVSAGNPVTDRVSDYIVPQARIIAAAMKPQIDTPLPNMSLEQRGNLREAAACAYAFVGVKACENAALETAIHAYGNAAQDYLGAGLSDRWAATKYSLGNTLRVLGERKPGTDVLKQAIASYRDALTVQTRADVPVAWATTQINLGNTLGLLSERENGTEHLAEAITAFREALKEHTRNRIPVAWAMTQSSLGSALGILGERETGTEHLAQAVTAFREALKENTRHRSPLAWATTQNNLGNALRALGARESGTKHLVEAVAAYREALKEYTRKQVPVAWATTQINLGSALGILGERENGTEHLIEAVAAFNEALHEYTRDRVPLAWATTQHNLGAALRTLGARVIGNEQLISSVAAYREALTERTRDRVPLDWAMTQNSLGAALGILGERETGTARLDEAIAACREASTVCTRTHSPYQWAHTQENLGILYHTMFGKTGDAAHLEAAGTHAAAAFKVFRKMKATDSIEKAEALVKLIAAAAPPS